MNDLTSILNDPSLLADKAVCKIINTICDLVFHANAQSILTKTFTAPTIKMEIDLFVAFVSEKGHILPACANDIDYQTVYQELIYPLKQKMLNN